MEKTVNFYTDLKDIPQSLRELAKRIEETPAIAVRVMVVLEPEDSPGMYQTVGYAALGRRPFTRAHCVGLLDYGKFTVMTNKGEG